MHFSINVKMKEKRKKHTHQQQQHKATLHAFESQHLSCKLLLIVTNRKMVAPMRKRRCWKVTLNWSVAGENVRLIEKKKKSKQNNKK